MITVTHFTPAELMRLKLLLKTDRISAKKVCDQKTCNRLFHGFLRLQSQQHPFVVDGQSPKPLTTFILSFVMRSRLCAAASLTLLEGHLHCASSVQWTENNNVLNNVLWLQA